MAQTRYTVYFICINTALHTRIMYTHARLCTLAHPPHASTRQDAQKDYEKYVEDSADKRTLDSKSIEEKEGMKAGLLGRPSHSFHEDLTDVYSSVRPQVCMPTIVLKAKRA